MAALILPLRQAVQPSQPAPVDWNSPLARGLVDGLYEAGGTRYTVSGKPPTLDGSVDLKDRLALAGLHGRKFSYINGLTRDRIALDGAAMSSLTLVILGVRYQSGGSDWWISGGITDSAGTESVWFEGGSGTTYFSAISSTGTRSNVTTGAVLHPVGKRSLVALTLSGGVQKGYIDGVEVASGSGPASIKTTGYLNAGGLSSTMLPWYGVTPLVLLYRRALSPAEIRALSDNPWQLFKPAQARIWVPASTPSGGTGTLTAAETGADAAALSGVAPTAGTLAATETGADTFSATSGATASTGSLTATEAGADTAAASASAPAAASLGALESGADTAGMTGLALVLGLFAATESGADTTALTGTLGAAASSGTLAAVESGADAAAAQAAALIAGLLAATEAGADAFSSARALRLINHSSTVPMARERITVRKTADRTTVHP